jgi:hypothetical protein
VDRRALRRVHTPGEAAETENKKEGRDCGMEMEIDTSHTRKERSPRKSGEGIKDTFLVPASAEKIRRQSKEKAHRTRTEDGESDTSIISRSSVASSPPVSGKKRKLAPSSVSPKVSENLMQELGTSSPADVSAEHARQVAIVMKVAINSTHLKGTYIRDLKNAAAFFSAAWKDKTRKRSRERRKEKEAKDENADARVTLLEEENATLRRELAEERAAVRERKIAVGWSWATVTAISKRPLQCYRCLELGHVRATCTSAVDRGNLYHRCGKSGHKARECAAAKTNCPLCEALGPPAGHRMGGIACVPPKIRRRRPPGQEVNSNYRRGPISVTRNDPGEFMETG